MTFIEMLNLKAEYGPEMKITKAVRLHDEDAWNEYEISYRGCLVGSELVSADFVRRLIKNNF